MSYRPGYRFRVSASREADGRLQLPRLYLVRYRFREAGVEPITTLEDEELVEVIAYKDGAVAVHVLRTDAVGWLG